MRQIRWDCEKSGCWKKKQLFKLGLFDGCFYSTCGMTDIDGGVDQYGHFLFIEFKKFKGEIPSGQELFWHRLTQLSDKITLFVVEANPEEDEVYSMSSVNNGHQSLWIDCDLAGLKAKMIEWRDASAARQRQDIEARKKP